MNQNNSRSTAVGKAFLVLIPILLTFFLQAQPVWPTQKNFPSHLAALQVLLSAQSQQDGKLLPSTLSLERSIGQSTNDNSQNAIVDSLLVSHTANGSSTYDYNMMLYAYNYPYNLSPSFHYPDNTSTPLIKFRSCQHWSIDPNTQTYGFYQADHANYDANNNMLCDTILHADSAINPNLILTNIFNASSEIQSTFSRKWSAGKADSSSKQFYRYDVSNRLIKDSTYLYHNGKWYLVSKNIYTYATFPGPVKIECYSRKEDTTLKLPLIIQLKYENTYDANGRLKTVQTSYHDSKSLMPYVRDTFAYTAGLGFHTSWKEYQYDPINAYWAPITFMHKTLNAALLPDTVYIDLFDSLAKKWSPMSKYKMFYNAGNNPVTLDEYTYNFISFPQNPDLSTHYYYENYTSTTAVQEDERSAEVLKIFPNPFVETITVDVSALHKGTGAWQLLLFDAQGKMITRHDVLSDTLTLELHLLPGNYSAVLFRDGKQVGSSKIIALAR